MKSIYNEPPNHWERLPLKALVDGPNNGAWGEEPGDGEIDVLCARVADFDWDHLRLKFQNPTYRSVKRAQFKRLALKSGDLLIEKSGGGEKTPVGRVVAFNDDVNAITSNFVAMMRPKDKFNSEFIKYLFAAHYMSGFTVQFIKQATGIQNLDDKPLMQTVAWVPDFEEQTTIVQFLNQEIHHINDLIAEKDTFITLLREKRVAEISHAVTKGINTGAPIKPSGVDWLGDVPAHWETVRLGVIFKEADREGKPDLPVLSVSIHDGVSDEEIANEDRARKVALSEDRSLYQGVVPGDLVYNMMRAWQGGFGAVATEGLVSPAYVVARPISDARTKFIELQLRTPQAIEEMRRYSKGIADFRMRLYWEHFRNVRVALPSPEEQDAILATIDRETTRIDGLIHETEHSIALLKEKRAALITAAVTGKIDVRSAA